MLHATGVRRTVPRLLLVAPVFLVGCALSHAGDSDGGPVDAGPSIDAHDWLLDAGPPDAGPTCSTFPLRPTTVCEQSTSAAGRALVATLYGCYCGETFTCRGAVEGDHVRLAVEGDDCPGPLCDGCIPLVSECELDAPLDPGTAYRVDVNGDPAFVLPSTLDPTIHPSCFHPAPPVPEGLICDYPDGPVASSDATGVCVPSQVDPIEPFVVKLTACVDCFDEPSGCSLYETSDGWRVEPTYRSCDCPTCGACSPECVSREFTCELPALFGRDRVVVRVGGEDHEVTADGSDNRACE
jgi:hypothetical protein